jgi:hypothetical protein
MIFAGRPLERTPRAGTRPEVRLRTAAFVPEPR